jgi:hypothetical protein
MALISPLLFLLSSAYDQDGVFCVVVVVVVVVSDHGQEK